MPVSRRGLFGLAAGAAVVGPSVVVAVSTAAPVTLEFTPIAPSVKRKIEHYYHASKWTANRLNGAQHIYNQRRSRLIANA